MFRISVRGERGAVGVEGVGVVEEAGFYSRKKIIFVANDKVWAAF